MNIDHHILLRYFSGESSEEEKEQIRQWLESDEANKKKFIRERIRFDASVVIGENEDLVRPASLTRRMMINSLKVASVVLLLIGCSYFYNAYRMRELGELMQDIYVPPGSRTSITLSEGSTVWLNSNTTFKYPSLFSDERIVELDGEGFFEIAKDTDKPFIVHTDKYSIEVLGTSFNLESYDNGSHFETALFTGKVKLFKNQENSDTVFLSAGETATLIRDELVISPTNYNLYRWKEGIIVIENESFEDIMALFEKYFDLKIVVQVEEVKELGYWGKFRMADGIDHALRVLQKDFSFTYKREEDSNIIYIY